MGDVGEQHISASSQNKFKFLNLHVEMHARLHLHFNIENFISANQTGYDARKRNVAIKIKVPHECKIFK